MTALVALAPAGTRERLVHVLHGEDAEGARHAGAQLHVLDAAGGLAADEVVVVGLAADHRAEAGDALVTGAGEVRRGQRQLERAGDVEDVGLPRAGLREARLRPGDQPLGEVLVEAPDGDGEAAPASISR